MKCDRQGVRTPADVERKYDLGSDAAMQTATNAQRTAARASADVDALNTSLNQTGVLARLTNSGESRAIYLDEDGQLYVRIDYLRGLVTDTLASLLSFSTETQNVLTIGGEKGGKPFLRLGDEAGKTLSWKDNGDGTYTLIGT